MPKTKFAFAIIVMCLLQVGCGTPLQNAVKSISGNTFQAQQPASNVANLGKRILKGSPEVNVCYLGVRSGSDAQSWNNIAMVYEGDARGDLKLDFGNTINVNAGAANKLNSEIKLENNEIHELDSLAFDPQSSCLQDEAWGKRYSGDGAVDEVIIRAVRAKTISIVSKDSTAATISADIKPVESGGVGGSLALSNNSSTTARYEGTSLFYAHQVGTYRTTIEQKIVKIPVSGSTPSLGSCSFTLIGVDHSQNKWGGQLNCIGDITPTNITAPLGSYNGKVKNGVTHSLRVSQSGPGFYDVEMNKVTVRDIR